MTPIFAAVLADTHPSRRPITLDAPIALTDRIHIGVTALLMASVGLEVSS
jgi:hypothetical protein